LSPKNKKHKLLFLDTMNFAKLSVEQQGKILNIPKLPKPKALGRKPKNKTEFEELKKYNIQDSRISREFLVFLYNGFQDIGADVKTTLAQTSMSLFRNKYLKTSYYGLDVAGLDFIFKSYYGGRTECFKRGLAKNIKYYDINSLYPYVMKNFEYPDPNSVRFKKMSCLETIKQYHGFSDVIIKSPDIKHPLLPYRSKLKLIFPIGEIRGVYTHIELREALKLGYKIKFFGHTYYYVRSCRPFKDFVTDLYNLRLKYKKDNNNMEFVVKILMNSLYGKFAQRFNDLTNVVATDNITYNDFKRVNFHHEPLNNIFSRVSYDSKPAVFCFPEWASYVTAYARLEIYKYITKYNTIYCDTDSVFTTDTIKTGQNLGMMKLEAEVIEGLFIRPKFYGIKTKNKDMLRIKGINMYHITKQHKYKEFKNFVSKPEPMIKYEKFTKFKEAVSRVMIPGQIVQTHKQFNLNDQKRVWLKPFSIKYLSDSKPIEITE